MKPDCCDVRPCRGTRPPGAATEGDDTLFGTGRNDDDRRSWAVTITSRAVVATTIWMVAAGNDRIKGNGGRDELDGRKGDDKL